MYFKKKINSEPWKIGFQKRINNILNSNKKIVIYIYEKPDTSTFRYRAYNMCQSLRHGDQWRGAYFFEDELHSIINYLDRISVVVFVRVRWSEKIDIFMNQVRRKKIPMLLDVDDLVFDVENLPLVMNTLNVDLNDSNAYSHWFSYVSRIWLTGKKCDEYVTTNSYLAQKIERVYSKKVHIIENFMNDEQIDYSKKLNNNKFKKKKYFEIGYFSGTPSHINDFKVVAPELKALLQKYSDIRLKVVGFMEFPEYLDRDVATKQIIHKPLVNFLELQEQISQSDVNIIPLVDNDFTNCKSELKFFEAAAVNTLSCATPTYVYKNNIVNGKNGFLCKQGDWYRIIEKIYNGEVNISQISSYAHQYCITHYAPKNQVQHIETVLNIIQRH